MTNPDLIELLDEAIEAKKDWPHGTVNFAYKGPFKRYSEGVDVLAEAAPQIRSELLRLRELERDLEQWKSAFSHVHVHNHVDNDDSCLECGLDLRNSIHKRKALGDDNGN